MQYKDDKLVKFGDLSFSSAGLGTVKLGRNQGIKYPHAFRIPSDNEVNNLLALAKDLGINLLDTAPAYGSSESRLGQLLAQRHDWIICTKVGEDFIDGHSHFNFSAKATRDSVHRSLKRLNTDYLDIVLIHSDGNDSDILANNETVEMLSNLKNQGKIRAIGLSGKTVEGGESALRDYDMDIAMITHNPIYQNEQSVIDIARDLGKGILIKKAFASGHLNQLGDNPIQRTMDCIFVNREVALSVILGTINPMHLRENIAAINTTFSKINSQ